MGLRSPATIPTRMASMMKARNRSPQVASTSSLTFCLAPQAGQNSALSGISFPQVLQYTMLFHLVPSDCADVDDDAPYGEAHDAPQENALAYEAQEGYPDAEACIHVNAG